MIWYKLLLVWIQGCHHLIMSPSLKVAMFVFSSNPTNHIIYHIILSSLYLLWTDSITPLHVKFALLYVFYMNNAIRLITLVSHLCNLFSASHFNNSFMIIMWLLLSSHYFIMIQWYGIASDFTTYCHVQKFDHILELSMAACYLSQFLFSKLICHLTEFIKFYIWFNKVLLCSIIFSTTPIFCELFFLGLYIFLIMNDNCCHIFNVISSL